MSERCQINWLSPLRLTLLVINAICFGGCITLLALGNANGHLVLVTIATGLSFGAGLAGAIFTTRQLKSHRAQETN